MCLNNREAWWRTTEQPFSMHSWNPCCFLDIQAHLTGLNNAHQIVWQTVNRLAGFQDKNDTYMMEQEPESAHEHAASLTMGEEDRLCENEWEKKEWGISNSGNEKHTQRERESVCSSYHRCPQFLLFPPDLRRYPIANASVSDVRAASGAEWHFGAGISHFSGRQWYNWHHSQQTVDILFVCGCWRGCTQICVHNRSINKHVCSPSVTPFISSIWNYY